MRCSSAAIRLALVSFTAVVFIGSQAGCAGPKAVHTWISPISLSANVPGLEVSPQLIERLAVRTELSRSEIEDLGLRIGKLREEDVRKLLNLERTSAVSRYVEYFDTAFGDSPEQTESIVWQRTAETEDFIADAISLGGFDWNRELYLRKSLKKAAGEGDNPEQIEARMAAYQLFREARRGAVRKARGYRQFVETLGLELDRREFDQNVGMVVDIRTSVERPTISPLSLVTMRCAEEPGVGTIPTLVFHERRRKCDDFGVCRVESVAALDDGPEYEALFMALKFDGRSYLDGCSIITQMLIDGAEVVRELPGKFTSHIAVQSR